MAFQKVKRLLESLRNAEDQNTPFQTRGPKRAVETPEKTGDPIVYFQIRESRKRHQDPIMDFLYAYCARVINRIWDLETVNHVSSCDGQAGRRKAILD